MTDVVGLPDEWGVLPVLVRVGPLTLPAYETMVTAALLAGCLLLLFDTRHRERSGAFMSIAGAALIGGAVGAKILEWAIQPGAAVTAGWGALLGGRTILGGLLGGTVAVALVKRRIGDRSRHGNLLAAPVALGLAIGRLGCFCRGCCYGTPTALPWGVDFGDGVPRHPTQLYEVGFFLLAFAAVRVARTRVVTPGRLFSALMAAYFAFRFGEEYLRAGAALPIGLTPYQLVAIAGFALFAGRELVRTRPPDPQEASRG